MKSDKKKMWRYMTIIFSSILFYVILQNLGRVSEFMSFFFSALTPVIIGIIFAFILNIPLVLFEEKVFAGLNRKGKRGWLRSRRAICLVISVAVVLGILVVALVLIIPEIKDTIVSLVAQLPQKASAAVKYIKDIIDQRNLPLDISKLTEKIDWNTISSSIIGGVGDTGTTVYNITAGVFSGVFDFFIGFVLSVYIVAQKEKLKEQASRVCLAFLPERFCRRLFHISRLISQTLTNFITGQLTEGLIIGVFCCIGMLIFQMPFVVMITTSIAITSLIPMFGAIIGTAFGAFMILLGGEPWKALIFIVYLIVVQQVDGNLIYPRVLGSSVGLPSMWVLCTVSVAGAVFGFVGMLLGVPAAAVIYALVREFVKKKELFAKQSVSAVDKK